MAHEYPIKQVLSVSKDGRSLMVSVQVGSKTVTRHLRDMRGVHPDDTIPERYVRLEEEEDQAQKALARLDDQFALLKKSPLKNLRETLVSLGFSPEESVKSSDKVRKLYLNELLRKRGFAKVQVDRAHKALEALKASDPKFVRYVVEPKAQSV